MKVIFNDWLKKCGKELGRLGITTSEEYHMNRDGLGSMVNHLLDAGLAVRIRHLDPKNKETPGYLVSVDSGDTFKPFS